MILRQKHAKLAAASIENIVNGSSSNDEKEPILAGATNVQAISVELKVVPAKASSGVKPKEGTNKCTACRKRVGLTGFNCKCVNLFCAVHRYSDKRDCPYDYRNAGQDAIANPVVLAEKLNKI